MNPSSLTSPDSLTNILNIDPAIVEICLKTDFQNQLDEAFEKEYKACFHMFHSKHTQHIHPKNEDFDIPQAYMVINGYVDIFCGKHIDIDFSKINDKLSLCYFNIFNMDENSIELFNKITVDSIAFGIVMYRSISVLKYECVEKFLTSCGFKRYLYSITRSCEYKIYILKKFDLTYQINVGTNYINFAICVGVHDKQDIQKNIKFMFDDCKLSYSN